MKLLPSRRSRSQVIALCSAVFARSLAAGSWMTFAAEPRADSLQICRAAVHQQGNVGFIGTIDFTFDLEQTGSGPIQQTGRLWIGPNGLARLDIRSRPGAEPVVCAIAGSEAWMVFTSSPLVHRASATGPGSQTGFHNQLVMQTQQLRSWKSTLLFARMDSVSPTSIELPTPIDNQLKFQARSLGSLVSPAEALECELYSVLKGNERRVARFSSSLGYDFQAQDWVSSDGFSLPRSVTIKSPASKQRWTATQINPRSARDADFLSEFQCPASFDTRFPNLVGACVYGPDGAESCTAWQAVP